MKKILTIFLLLFTGVAAFAQSSFNADSLLKTPPSKPALVNDYSGVLTADQSATLEAKLETFDDSTTSQIEVVIIPSLGDYDASDYAIKLGTAWGVGGKQFNNGIVLLICTDPDNHQIFIATGDGMEGALPDITCEQIMNNEIKPAFRGSDYYGGINQGTDAIIKATKGEYKAPADYHQQQSSGSAWGVLLPILFIIIIIVLRSGGGGGFGGFLLGSALGSSFGGGGGFSSGGGGGFSGFGGGSFGGGGAGGSW